MSDLSVQEKYHLSMWLHTILQPTDGLIKYTQRCKQKNILITIMEAYQFLSKPYKNGRKIQQKAKLYIIANMMDHHLVNDSQKHQNNHLIQKYSTTLKKLIKQSQIQYHREAMIFSRLLAFVPAWKLFAQLDKEKLGYITIEKIIKFIENTIGSQEKFKFSINIQITDYLHKKLVNNIHNSYENYKKTNHKIYLEQFTQLIERIGFHHSEKYDVDQIGTLKTINEYLNISKSRSKFQQIQQQYCNLKQTREKKQAEICRKEIIQMSDIANKIVTDNYQSHQLPFYRIKSENNANFQQSRRQFLQINTPKEQKSIKNQLLQDQSRYQNSLKKFYKNDRQKPIQMSRQQDYSLKQQANNQVITSPITKKKIKEPLIGPLSEIQLKPTYRLNRQEQQYPSFSAQQQLSQFTLNKLDPYESYATFQRQKLREMLIQQQIENIRIQRVKNRINMYLYT